MTQRVLQPRRRSDRADHFAAVGVSIFSTGMYLPTIRNLLRLFLVLCAGTLIACGDKNAVARERGTKAVARAGGSAAVRVPGTYSNLEYNEDGGDLAGVELKIIPLERAYQGALIVSEGEPQPMVLVDVIVRGDEVSFEVPGEDGVAWRFAGRITSTGLLGKISYAEGGVADVSLQRQCGYWDRSH